MKRYLVMAVVIMFLLNACEPSQKVTGSWVNPQLEQNKKYTSIFIAALTERQPSKTTVETELATFISSKGYKATKSSEVFIPNFTKENASSKEVLLEKIRQLGCDAIFTVALVDRQSETRYVPGSAGYAPYGVYGGSFWGYYSYWYPQGYTPGYVTTDKTYFLEGNLFDAATEQLVWSVQTEAYNPASIEKFSKQYAQLLWKRVEKDFKR